MKGSDQMTKATIFTGTIDHSGFVVPDIDAAVNFFVDVLGFEVLQRPGRMQPADDSLTRYFGVHTGAVMEGAAFLQYGGRKIELVQWSAPRQVDPQLNPADVGAAHLAITVSDLSEAKAYFEHQPNVTVREMGPLGFFYITTPWGMEIQIMQQP
ncbi:bleomycin resistance protein [Lactiplantibacillus pentosus]|jgi:catechol 2,3-dioxygenase-like lactoylglutathione lyase family enzyme|nr:bleomycin resistance protein [Lactiplantibacillus pentosus]AYG39065.1 bleomycin resistance protein [Lactiplantibacillus pentosus]AYG41724.1 bleomycin resistance protein [Lactiplantibacillus pentosus]MBU7502806.1 VOC family protein [Lactiplantibacillus pentosus]MCT3290973.1 bleomycin resistance protein [Lactiplantibacillus pentosus]